MTRLVLVRHGRATAGWDVDPDPGLDDVGLAQAVVLGEQLGGEPAQPILCSPLQRCRETARPLAAAWGVAPTYERVVAEIPSPEGVPMGERVEWLRQAMTGTWHDLGERYTSFRDSLVVRVSSLGRDTVIVSHFVAINAVIGAAIGDDRVLIRSLDNCSRTVIDVSHGRLVLVEGGHEADTLIR